MDAGLRTQKTRVAVTWLIVVGAIVGILVAAGVLMGLAEGWPEWAAGLAAVAIVFAGFFAMAVALRRYATVPAEYRVEEGGLVEVLVPRGAPARERRIAWPEVRRLRAGVGVGGVSRLHLYARGAPVKLWWAAADPRRAEYEAFAAAVCRHLARHGVQPAPEGWRRGLLVAFAWMLLLVLGGTLAYALALPAHERPELWWLRWLVLAGIAAPFIGFLFRKR